ncbi:MAG: J domain-containing protein [Nitriliruptoraceae bacterium]
MRVGSDVPDDLYQLLGVARDASADDIKRAYRRQAREHHPDAGGDEEAFKKVTHAHHILSDPQRRARYDRFGDDGTPSTQGSGDPFGFQGGGFGGIDDVIDAFFGSGFGGRRAGRSTAGRDVLVVTELTLEEVVTGVTRDVQVEVAVGCTQCGGSGSADGAGAGRCRTCGGAGQVQQVVRTAFGQVATATACPDCRGSGRAIDDPCVGCAGEGRRVENRSLTVEVPAGIEPGDRLRISGAGEAGRNGSTPGDLFVEIRVADHELFDRQGRDLVAEVVVPVTQAALGGTLTIPSIDGEDVEVPVPAGTQPGDVLLVRRAGVPTKGGGRRGDLRLVVRVEIPTRLDDDQRDLLRRFADLRGESLDASGSGLFARLRDALQR